MELKCQGNAREQLLFRLLGVAPRDNHDSEADEYALLLGNDAPAPEQLPYLRLPDPGDPDRESEQLARLLGGAIGIGKVHL